MPLFQNSKIYIPNDWSTQQAFAVFDFLEDILAAIWDLYGNDFLETNDKSITQASAHEYKNPLDDLPF